jgi:hypothetical protein
MPDLLVQLDAGVAIRGTVVKDWAAGTAGKRELEVFSAVDFIVVVCQLPRNHARTLWLHLRRAFEAEGLLCHVALRIKTRASQPKEFVATQVGPALAREGLRRLLEVLGGKVKLRESAWRGFLEDSERNMIVEYDLYSHVPCVKA